MPITSRLLTISWAVVSLLPSLTGCGKAVPSHASKVLDTPSQPDEVTYSAWCSGWGLDCSPAEAKQDPAKDLTPSRWKSLLKIANSFGQSAGSLDLTAADLNDPIFKQTSQTLGVAAAWNDFQDQLNAAKFSSLHVGGGAFVVNTSAPTNQKGPSHLIESLGTQVILNVTPDQRLSVSGLTLAGPAKGKDTLRTLDVTDAGFFVWSGDNTKVTNVPAAFLKKEIAGGKEEPAPATKPAYKDLEALVMPLATWFSSRDGISIDIGPDPLQILAGEVPNFVSDAQTAAALTTVLQKITAVRSTAASRPQYLFEATASSTIICAFNNQAQLQLAEHFALTEIKTLDDGNVSLTFDGIKAVLGTSGLTFPVDIKRIDLTPTSIIIQELPLIGSLTIPMDDSSTPTPAPTPPTSVSFTCS